MQSGALLGDRICARQYSESKLGEAKVLVNKS